MRLQNAQPMLPQGLNMTEVQIDLPDWLAETPDQVVSVFYDSDQSQIPYGIRRENVEIVRVIDIETGEEVSLTPHLTEWLEERFEGDDIQYD